MASTTATPAAPARASFVPPYFRNFGKNVKDLFKKKYDYDVVVKTVNKSAEGVTFESSANVSQAFRGNVKAKYACKSFGEADVDVNTSADVASKATAKFTKLSKGLTVTVTGTTKDDDRVVEYKKPTVQADFEYSQDFVAAQAVVKTDGQVHKVDAAAAVGFDGFSVGGQVVLNATKGAEVVATNVGVEYTKGDYTASVFTENNTELVNAAYFQKLNKNTVVGAHLKYELSGKQDRQLVFGTEYQLDVNTTVKASATLPRGLVATAIEQRLENPRLQVGVATQFNVKSAPLTAEKFGLSLTFGDF